MGPHEATGYVEEDGLDIEIVDHLDFDAVDETPFLEDFAAAMPLESERPATAGAQDEDASRADPTEESSAPSAANPGRPTNAFVSLAAVMVDVMCARGATPDRAHFLRALLGLERMEERSPGEVASAALIAARYVAVGGRGLARTPEFAAQALAWRQILDGESDDFSACGSMPLDEWAASVIANTLGDPSQAGGIRRDLRRHGVAAFGIVSDSAAA